MFKFAKKKFSPRILSNKVSSIHSISSGHQKLVLGCGSNVVDQIYKVQAVPTVGTKGFFLNPTKTLEKSIVGGVTLNHLAWASLLGVPTGLLALQGTDSSGRLIRSKLKDLKINGEFVVVKDGYKSSESFVFLQSDGERSIIMAPGATSLLDDANINRYFEKSIREKASMVTSEISQVPLTGVIKLLNLAKESGVLSIVDLDVSPSVALNEAKLGSMAELEDVLCSADVIKPTLHAAEEFITIKRPDLHRLTPTDVVKYLIDLTGAKMIAVTNGAKNAIIGTENHIVNVPVKPLKKVVDATGAGDAFLGGLIAGVHFNGFPSTEDELWELGELSNKTGACNCMVLGALPNQESKHQLRNEIEHFDHFDQMFNIDKKLDRTKTDRNKTPFLESVQRDLCSIQEMSKTLDLKSALKFVELIDRCTGNVLVSGIGKSGVIGNRFAASLSSLGIASHFIHASEWAHGDLGKINGNDIVIFISHSGNTEEVARALEFVKRKHISILALVGSNDSVIGKACDNTLCYNVSNLTEPLGGIPTTSLVLQDVILNAVLGELIDQRGLTRLDFLVNHPGGSLGKKFSSPE